MPKEVVIVGNESYKKVIIIDCVDLFSSKEVQGGSSTFIVNMLKFLKPEIEIEFIGIDSSKKDKTLRQEFLKQYSYKRNFMTRSLYNQKDSGRLYSLVPHSLIFMFHLWIKKKTVIQKKSILHIHRIDYTLPFVLPSVKMPIVLTVHGIASKYMKDRGNRIAGSIFSVMEDVVLKRVDKIILVSEVGRDYYSEKYPDLVEKFVVIPTGIDTNLFFPRDKLTARKEFGFGKEDKIILFVGRLKKEKGLDFLLQSFKTVSTNLFPKSKLVIVGDGPERDILENLIKKMKLRNVLFMGNIPHDKIPGIMCCADVFALTSIFEGMPTVVLEALGCGIPVVTTDVGDVSKAVKDGKTGFVVYSRDSTIFASKLEEAIINNKNMSENCVNIAQKFSWLENAKKMENVYNEFIN